MLEGSGSGPVVPNPTLMSELEFPLVGKPFFAPVIVLFSAFEVGERDVRAALPGRFH